MKTLLSTDIITPALSEGALIHDEYDGFREDYLVLHCLLRRFVPESIFEIGTNIGSGINVMATALPEAKIFSLDLDYETMRQNSKQYPLEADGGDRVGSAVKAHIQYTQLRGDSMSFDYGKYPCEAYFIDGEHDYRHAYHESRQAILQSPKLIIWHDADMTPVHDGIKDAFDMPRGERYELFRVSDTRIAYAVKKHEK